MAQGQRIAQSSIRNALLIASSEKDAAMERVAYGSYPTALPTRELTLAEEPHAGRVSALRRTAGTIATCPSSSACTPPLTP